MGTAILRSNLELSMQFIPTTSTAVEKLRSEAKATRRASGMSHTQSLEAVAITHGYASWKHVTASASQTLSASKPRVRQTAVAQDQGLATTANESSSLEGLAPRESWVIPHLSVTKMAPGLYGYAITYGGQELLADEGFESISSAIYSAADITGPILGFEVSYSGVTAGTFPLDYLRADSQEVASRAVEMVTELHAAAR